MARWLDGGFGRRHALRYRCEAPLRRPWHVLAPVALLVLAALALALLLPPRYRAAAVVLAKWDAADDAAMRNRGLDVAERRRQAVSERVLDRAAFARLLQGGALGPREGPIGPDEVARLLDAARVKPQGANAFRIECVQEDATRAALIANLLATDVVERSLNDPVKPPIARLELLRAATVPEAPESPGPVLFALAGAALGLALGLASALVAEHRDHTVKGPEDLAEILPLPLLATIPLVRKRREHQAS